MLRTLVLLLSLPLLGGCANVDGIWYFVIDIAGDAAGETTITENYTDGDVPTGATTDPADPWTYNHSSDASPSTGFAQFTHVSDNRALLVFDGHSYVGSLSEGAWVFRWDAFEEETDDRSHEAGYVDNETSRVDSAVVITMDVTGNTAEGTMRATSTQGTTWRESDTWDPDTTGVYATDVPSSSYLLDADGYGVENDPERADCQGSDCNLEVKTTCSSTHAFTGSATSFEDEDAYAGVAGVGQPEGASSY